MKLTGNKVTSKNPRNSKSKTWEVKESIVRKTKIKEGKWKA